MMKITGFSKFAVSASLALAVVSCTTNPSVIPGNNSDTNTIEQNTKSTLIINLSDIFNQSKSQFSVKKFPFDDSAVVKIRVRIYAPDSNGNIVANPESEKIVNKSDGLSTLYLSVLPGNNKIVVIETLDTNDLDLSRLMAAVTISSGTNTTLKINYGTYPVAKILKMLMDNTDVNNEVRKLASTIDLKTLENYINAVTGYDINTNTYSGINPAYVDFDSILKAITDKKGCFFTITNKVLEDLKDKLRKEIIDTLKSLLNMCFTEDLFKDELSKLMLSVQEKELVMRTVLANVVPDYKTNRDNCLKGLETCLDKEIKGKLRVTLKNSGGTILTGFKITLNDLLASNVQSNSDNITTIDNISSGTWLLSATGYDSGKSIFINKYLQVVGCEYAQALAGPKAVLPACTSGVIMIASNQANPLKDPGAQAFTTDALLTLLPVAPTVKDVKIENPNNNNNIPVPSNIDLQLNRNVTFTAKVLMTDGTTNSNLTWSANNTNVSVGNGSIYASVVGTSIVTVASTDDPSKFKTINVNVVANVSDGPDIYSFTPTSTSTGTSVTITGNNFDDTNLNSTTVKFNGVAGTVTKVSKTELTVTVPGTATTGNISVTTAKGTSVSSGYFIVSSPANTTGMIFIPKNDFYMGYNGGTDNDYYPRHQISLRDFHIDKTEVTNLQFADFIKANCYVPASACDVNWSAEGLAWRNLNNITVPSYWYDTRFNQSNQPIVGISWYEADAYARWLGRRLPTEAEWEYASRGKTELIYPWGSDAPSDSSKKANGYFGDLGKGDDYQYSANVGSYSNGDSPFGLKDMSGNVYEWTNDWYSQKYYSNSPLENPQGPAIGGSKVLRGGSWYNHPYFNNDVSKLQSSMTTYYRFFSSPANRSNYIGFRTAK